MVTVSRSLMFTLSVFGLATMLAAQDPKPAKPGDAQPKETFVVVEMAHHLKAMTTTAEAALAKEKHDAFEKAQAEYDKARTAAEAAKKQFTGKAPHEEMIEVKKAGLATMAEAEKFIEEQKKAEKPAPAPKPKEKPKAPHKK